MGLYPNHQVLACALGIASGAKLDALLSLARTVPGLAIRDVRNGKVGLSPYPKNRPYRAYHPERSLWFHQDKKFIGHRYSDYLPES